MAGEKLAGYIAGIGLIGALAINASFNDTSGVCRVNTEDDKVEILSPKSGKVIQSHPKENVEISGAKCYIGQGTSAIETFKLQQ